VIVSDWYVGEQVAAAWVRRFGWEDAEVTPDGRDNGIDVWARGAVAQVKIWKHKRAGIAEVQRLAGSAKPGQSCLFFSADGYTRAALAWSYHLDHRVALFELLPDGRLVACNWHAWRISQEAPFRPGPRQSAGVSDSCSCWGLLGVALAVCRLGAGLVARLAAVPDSADGRAGP
jgi:Restriction endonuclease